MNATIERGINKEKVEKYKHIFNLGKMKCSRIPEILLMRLDGNTLEYIAKYFSVTRERIRQQEAKGIEMIEEHESLPSSS